MPYHMNMTAKEFRAWRDRMGWSQQRVADALDLSISTVKNYELGFRRGSEEAAKVPRVVEMACRLLELGRAAAE